MRDIFDKTAIGDEYLSLWKEYEQRKTIESKIVKDADNLDVDFEMREQEFRGYKFHKKWATMRKYVAGKKLYTKSAKALWKRIQSSNPQNWHVNSRNRFNDGDWHK